MPVSIFVSYSHQDAGLVKPVVGLLRATKDLVFQDIDGIRPGGKWRPQIDEALHVAHLIVLFWCSHSSRSTEVKKEYKLALSTGKDVLPVLLDTTPLPEELNEFQWVDFRQLSGHRSSKHWLILTSLFVLVMGFLFLLPLSPRTPLPPPPPGSLPPEYFPPPPPHLVFAPVLFVAAVLVLVIWIVRRIRRNRTGALFVECQKQMAETLQVELLRRGISSV